LPNRELVIYVRDAASAVNEVTKREHEEMPCEEYGDGDGDWDERERRKQTGNDITLDSQEEALEEALDRNIMQLYNINKEYLDDVITGIPEEIRCCFLRSGTGRWHIEDWEYLQNNHFANGALYFWKFTRILRKSDIQFGKMAKKFGKDINDDWRPFDKWPSLGHNTISLKKHECNGKSYASGFVKIPINSLSAHIKTINSLINTTEFAKSGFIVLSSNEEILKFDCIEAINKYCDVLIEYKSKEYKSQEEWDIALPFRENEISSIIQELGKIHLTTFIPVSDENVEIGLLAFVPENCTVLDMKTIEEINSLKIGTHFTMGLTV